MLPGVYNIFNNIFKNKAVFCISDTHFGDKDIQKAYPDRPSDDELVKNINSKVGKNGILLLLGDCGDPTMCAKLRGYKVLVMGNHDAGRSNYERRIFTYDFPKDHYTKSSALASMKQIFPNCRYSINEYAPFEYWEIIADNKLFDLVFTGPLILGEKLILSHEPLDIDWAFNIHGHCHQGPVRRDANHLNVCSDVINCSPVNLNQLMKNGLTSKVCSVHRQSIGAATKNKKWREQKRRNV